MNKLIVATGLALGLAASAFAQPASAERGARVEQRAERHAEHLTEKLGLTEAQKLEVEAIFAEQGAAQRELHERFRAERKALREQGDARLDQILSAEQKAQLDQMRAERKETRRGKHRGGARHSPEHGG